LEFILFLCGIVARISSILLKCLYCSYLFLVVVWARYSWCDSPQICISISYFRNRLLQAFLIIALHDCLTNWMYQEFLSIHGAYFKSLTICLLLWSWSWIYLHYTTRIVQYTYCLWQLVFLYVVVSMDHLHLGFCFLLTYFLPRNCYCSHCLSCFIVDCLD
jgi:hypothetical protein